MVQKVHHTIIRIVEKRNLSSISLVHISSNIHDQNGSNAFSMLHYSSTFNQEPSRTGSMPPLLLTMPYLQDDLRPCASAEAKNLKVQALQHGNINSNQRIESRSDDGIQKPMDLILESQIELRTQNDDIPCCSNFNRMLFDMLVQHPEQMQRLLKPFNQPTQLAPVDQRDCGFDFLAFTAIVATMAFIEHQKDQQLSQCHRLDSEVCLMQYRGESRDCVYYSDDNSVEYDDRSYEQEEIDFSPRSCFRQVSNQRESSFCEQKIRQHSQRSVDTFDDNYTFDFGADIKIAVLEDQLEDQEEEILDLQDEIKKLIYKAHHMANDLNAHKSAFFELEDKYAMLKVDLAAAQSALDDQKVATEEALVKTDLQLLEVSLELQHLLLEKTVTHEKISKMQKYIKRLERSVEAKDVRYQHVIETNEATKEELSVLLQDRDHLQRLVDSIVTPEMKVVVPETTPIGRRWGRSSVFDGMHGRFKKKATTKAQVEVPS